MRLLLFSLLMLGMIGERPKKLEDFKWKNRIVLYFPQSPTLFQELSSELNMGIRERKILFFVFGEQLNTNSEVDFSKAYVAELIKKYKSNCKDDCWVLIGLDGSIKLRMDGELDWVYIFKTIDSMPMRRSEIG
ncbi:DUF4174 domain-containing protein [Cecembia rubra]|uniref:DUF4174 domain-containing protein n=1 Tax=Cecembia rubra TaxID=1485585 RepID=UPI00271451D7|nr:DUF4174 domain-containing protein [Cecembia rubra]